MVIDTLRSSDLFGSLSTSDLEKVAVICRSANFRQNVVVFKEEDEATEVYVVLEGEVAREMTVRPVPYRPAMPMTLDVCTKGEILGWSALVEPYTYTLSARCLTNCTLLAIKGDMLRRLMDEDVRLGYELLKRLSQLIKGRLAESRLRLTSGLGLVMLGKELQASE